MAFTYRKTVKALNNSMELIAKSLKSRLEETFSDASGDLVAALQFRLLVKNRVL